MMLLSEVWNQYKSDKQLDGYSPKTIESYELQNRLFIRHVGDVDIEDISYNTIKQYLAKDAERLKPASIAFTMKYFRSVWRYAQDEGIITFNPAAKLRDPKQGKRIPKAMDEEAIEWLRTACQTPLENVILELFFSTGCRIGEVTKLNRNAVNYEGKSIIVNGKGDKEREVFYSTRCAIWLKKYMNTRSDTNMALIVTVRNFKSEGGQPRRMSDHQLRRVIKRIANRAGIDNVYPHKLRHSYATHLLNNGAPLEVIQSFLGHADLRTTKIYAHMSGNRRRQLYEQYF